MQKILTKANIIEDQLNDSYARVQGRRADADKEDHIAKAAMPEKFTKEKEWNDFEIAFTNYLSTIQGSYGVPLSYIIREGAVPQRNTHYATFEDEAIAKSPLNGPVFQRDAKKVHQLLLSLTNGGPGEEWMKANATQQNGRTDMLALKAHFSGEGNASRRITEAERIRNNLHYKSEQSLPFSTFLDRLQKMFNIYDKQGKTMSDSAKTRTLLNMCKGVQHISSAIAALHVKHNQGRTTFTSAANHLQSMVSQHAVRSSTSARHISQVQSNPDTAGRGRGQGCGREGRGGRERRGGRGGRINTTFRSHLEWNKLSYEERDRIRSEHTKCGEKGGHPNEPDNVKRRIEELVTQSREMLSTARELAQVATHQEQDDEL